MRSYDRSLTLDYSIDLTIHNLKYSFQMFITCSISHLKLQKLLSNKMVVQKLRMSLTILKKCNNGNNKGHSTLKAMLCHGKGSNLCRKVTLVTQVAPEVYLLGQCLYMRLNWLTWKPKSWTRPNNYKDSKEKHPTNLVTQNKNLVTHSFTIHQPSKKSIFPLSNFSSVNLWMNISNKQFKPSMI